MPVYERLSMVVSLILIGLALYFVIDFPARIIPLTIFGFVIEVMVSTRVLMVILLGGLALTGAGAVVHANPQHRAGYTVPFWVNSTLIVMLATLTLARLGGPVAWAGGLFVTGALLWLSLLSEYRVIEAKEKAFNWAVSWSQGVSYALVPIYALIMYQSGLSTGIVVLSIAVISGFLGASVFKLYASPKQRYNLFSYLTALIMAEGTWLLKSYIPVSPVQAALCSLLLFYVICGLINTRLSNIRLTYRILAEYGAVTGLGVLLIVWLQAQ